MKRTFETYGKNGVIEIKGNPQETILYLRNKPIQYSWLAEIGSTWRYHIAQGLNKQIVKLHNGITDMLRRGISNEGEFLATTEFFVQFFKYGKYEFGHYKLFEDIHWLEIPKTEDYNSFDFYGGMFHFAPTQNSIDEKLVEEYKEQILRGSSPTMVILHVENSHKFFILDGHHKFLGYQKAKIAANSIIISKLGNDYKSIKETMEIARLMKCEKNDYLKRMQSEKSNMKYYEGHKIELSKLFNEVKY